VKFLWASQPSLCAAYARHPSIPHASDGTRRAPEAARRIRAGEIEGVTVEEHEPFADAAVQPELIAATTDALHPLVLVEGHARLTAYALFPERLPAQLEILLGISPEMPGWCQF